MLHHISEILAAAVSGADSRIAVAAAHDEDVLRAAVAARRQKIAAPVLVGHEQEIRAILTRLGEDAADYRILPADDDTDCARRAVACIVDGSANFLMKGLLSTADLMRAVLDKETGIRTGNLISHVMIYECPAYHKLLYLTDGGVNTFPNLEQKAGILENGARVVRALGYDAMNAACVCGAEAVSPKIQATVDADALSQMTERWAPYHMNVFGPVGLDLAVSPEACHHKKYAAPGAGDADILLVPSYEMGNGIGKSMSYFGSAKNAGIIVGARVPIVLVSRADSAESKLASIALGSIVASKMQ